MHVSLHLDLISQFFNCSNMAFISLSPFVNASISNRGECRVDINIYQVTIYVDLHVNTWLSQLRGISTVH